MVDVEKYHVCETVQYSVQESCGFEQGLYYYCCGDLATGWIGFSLRMLSIVLEIGSMLIARHALISRCLPWAKEVLPSLSRLLLCTPATQIFICIRPASIVSTTDL